MTLTGWTGGYVSVFEVGRVLFHARNGRYMDIEFVCLNVQQPDISTFI